MTPINFPIDGTIHLVQHTCQDARFRKLLLKAPGLAPGQQVPVHKASGTEPPLVGAQHGNGIKPAWLAFGEQTLEWGVAGQFKRGLKPASAAFCIEVRMPHVDALQG